MPNSIKCVEALAQADGPFQRLLELTETLFDGLSSAISLAVQEEAVVRVSNWPRLERIELSSSIVAFLGTLPRGEVGLFSDVSNNSFLKAHPKIQSSWAPSIVAAPIHGDQGSVVGALIIALSNPNLEVDERFVAQMKLLAGMAEDIVAGIEAARLRDERLESLKLVEQMSGVGQWRLDRLTQTLEWSDVVYDIHGVDRETFKLTLESAVSAYLAEDAAQLGKLIEQAWEKGVGYVERFSIRRADGVMRRVEGRAEAERDENGQVVALYGVFQDITEQEELLTSIRRNERRYRLLAENIGDVLTRVKMDGSSKYISPAIKPLLGWTFEEMSGRAMDYVAEEDRHRVLALLRQAVRTGEPIIQEFQAVHRDGHRVWVECTFRAVQREGGVNDDVIVVIRDASRRKALEQEVLIAKERAEKAAAAKSEFLANMSHELRTPLTGVIGFANLLSQSKALPEKERLYAERIAVASDALLEVINDILDYSKLEADAIELDPITFDPRSLIMGAVSIVEKQCQDKGLRLEVSWDDSLPEALIGDAGRLRQVMLNFLSNAVKFTSVGSVRVVGAGHAMPDGRWHMRFEVQDTGIGIAPEILPGLFDRFTQADASTTRLYGGTGLGLAISQRLIQMMQGRIWVQSQPGEGARFCFEVPLGLAHSVLDNDAAVGFESAEGPVQARVLMADDAPANRELMTAILGSMGLDLHTVNDGVEVVQAVRDGRYDLVLMDVHMPVMDGLEATKTIRQIETLMERRTPIVALTANVQAEQVARCLEAGMDGHLSKPIQLPELAKVLSRWLVPQGAGEAEADFAENGGAKL